MLFDVLLLANKHRQCSEKVKRKKKKWFDHQYKSSLLFCALVQALYTLDIHTAVRELCVSATTVELKY